VAKVELTPASKYAGADPAATTWAFREDRAAYTETRQGALTRRTLSIEFAATPTARAAVDALVDVAASEGVVARVTMASGEVIVAGHSSRFGSSYPLRPTSLSSVSGLTPGDMPTISLTLETTH
jgi:hypothetical protein